MNFNNTQYIQRFRGQSYGNTPTSGPPYSSTPTYPMSSYLRHRMNSNSSLGEALATLPTPPASNKSKTPDSPASLTTQVLMRKRGENVTGHSFIPFRQPHSEVEEAITDNTILLQEQTIPSQQGPSRECQCWFAFLSNAFRLISTFIIAAAAVFFLILAWKYFSLVPRWIS